jgi:hypothetical protein
MKVKITQGYYTIQVFCSDKYFVYQFLIFVNGTYQKISRRLFPFRLKEPARYILKLNASCGKDFSYLPRIEVAWLAIECRAFGRGNACGFAHCHTDRHYSP